MKLLTNERQKLHENAKVPYICKKKFKDKSVTENKYCKVRDHFHYIGEYRGAVYSICRLKYSVPKS